MKEVLDFLKANPVFFLATVEGDQPRVRPFGAVAEFGGKLYLTTNNGKDVYKQMQANPKVELCGWDAKGGWLRVAASIVVDPDNGARAHMLEENPNLKNMYSLDDGKYEVFYLKDATASFCSMAAAPRVVTF